MGDEELKNIFVSLEVPESLTEELRGIQDSLPEGVWRQPREQLHLTLGYFSKVDPEKEARVQQFLAELIAQSKEIKMALNGKAQHGSWVRQTDPTYKFDETKLQRQEQLRLGMVEDENLMRLRQQVIEFAKTEGLLPPEFPEKFSPHITIGEANEDILMAEVMKSEVPQHEHLAELVTLQQEIDSRNFAILSEHHFRGEGHENEIRVR